MNHQPLPPTHPARRLLLAAVAAGLVSAMLPALAGAATISVCPSGCPYSQISDAVASADRGDTINVAAGTYQGGFTIGVSLKIVGAGADSTVIRGGGPVITIGSFGATTDPTVSIDAVTITGGVTRSSPESIPFSGERACGRWAAASTFLRRSARRRDAPAGRRSPSRTA
jgi:hypothetical protein